MGIFSVADDFPVHNFYDTGSVKLCNFSLVGDENHQLFPGNSFDNVHDFQRILAVQISCRFIRDDNFGVFYDGTSDADTLPFPAGKHFRRAVFITVNADPFQDVHNPLFNFLLILNPHHAQNQRYVVKNCLILDEIIVLENISNICIPDFVFLSVGTACQTLIADINLTAVHFVKTADGIKQSRLSTAGISQESDKPLIGEFYRSAVDGSDFVTFLLIKIFVYIC